MLTAWDSSPKETLSRTSQPHPQLVLYLLNRLRFPAGRHPPSKCILHMDPRYPVHVSACLSFLHFLAALSQGPESSSSQLPVSFLEPAGKVVVVVVVKSLSSQRPSPKRADVLSPSHTDTLWLWAGRDLGKRDGIGLILREEENGGAQNTNSLKPITQTRKQKPREES